MSDLITINNSNLEIHNQINEDEYLNKLKKKLDSYINREKLVEI
tara:strand:+ start:147 stop:278 length:132 start_codon:yes stop_codon:yes gene_type:complete